VHKEYVDYVSGDFTKRQGQRLKDVAYQELMEDVNRRVVDCVIVWKYDRFARSLSVLISTLQQFNSLGVDFISYTQHIDTTTPMGRLFFHIIGSFAEFEREMISERVRAGLAKVRAQGKTLGPPIRDRDAAARIQALRDQGFSLREIARREGYSPAGVLKILRRSKV
jgi:DNA invertase Pin-like site-specific DNA recombinase